MILADEESRSENQEKEKEKHTVKIYRETLNEIFIFVKIKIYFLSDSKRMNLS